MEQVNVEHPNTSDSVEKPQPQKVTPFSLNSPSPKKPLIIVGVLLGFMLFGVGGYLLDVQQSQMSKATDEIVESKTPSDVQETITPQPTITSSSDSKWKTYTSTKYSYKIEYPPDKTFTEEETEYGYTDFLAGCVRVFVVPPGFENEDLQSRTGVPWAKLPELQNLTVGESKKYALETWKLGNEEDFVLEYVYNKLPNKELSGSNWTALEATNNWENHGVHNIYFTSRNNSTYLINMLSYGPCYEDEPVRMLSTFEFTD